MTQPHPHAVHRSWDRDYSTIVRTDGVYLYDDRGRRYIDATGGSSVVVTIGHGVQAINDVMYEQSKQFNFYPAHAFSNKPFQDLSDLIVSLAPGGLKDASKVWITCTGTVLPVAGSTLSSLMPTRIDESAASGMPMYTTRTAMMTKLIERGTSRSGRCASSAMLLMVSMPVYATVPMARP